MPCHQENPIHLEESATSGRLNSESCGPRIHRIVGSTRFGGRGRPVALGPPLVFPPTIKAEIEGRDIASAAIGQFEQFLEDLIADHTSKNGYARNVLLLG
jgi:hypothetical protein